MGNVLAFCEFADGNLRSSALANIAFARTAAQAHGGEVIALLVGPGAAGAGANAAKFAPKVITVEDGGLTNYLADRPVRCEPADARGYRCTVGGQDLSRVVLFNGGARAAFDAPPALKDAEARARDARRGVWASQGR